jgi:hypothetical protein
MLEKATFVGTLKSGFTFSGLQRKLHLMGLVHLLLPNKVPFCSNSCRVICYTAYPGGLERSHLWEKLSKAAALCVTFTVIHSELCNKCGPGYEELHSILKSIILALCHLHHCLACISYTNKVFNDELSWCKY